MGKRRASSAVKGSRRSENAAVPAKEARVRLHVRGYEDVADSEDEFFLNRDQVLLEEQPAQKRQRRLDEEDAFLQPSDEDVLPLPNEDEDEDEDEELDDGDEEDARQGMNGRSRRDQQSEDALENEGLTNWGDSKRDYYNADLIETEADALEEEKEALRIQKRQLQGMKDADYGLDEWGWAQDEPGTEAAVGESRVVQEVMPELEITDSMTEEEKAKILSSRYPEFEPLSRDFLRLQPVFEDLDAAAVETDNANELSAVAVKRNILASYLGSLAMYFAILTSGPKGPATNLLAKSPLALREHPVMESLMSTRTLWEKVQDMQLPESKPMANHFGETVSQPAVDDLAVKPAATSPVNGTSKPKKSRKSKAQLEAEVALQEVANRRAQRMLRVEEDLAKLSLPPTKAQPSQSVAPMAVKVPRADSDSGSDLGENEAITAEQAEDKDRRKRGLRFHTSKITAKSLKRDRATREGGDMDVPYRERLRDRQIRLNAAAEKRGKAVDDKRTALDADAESDDEDRAARALLRSNGDENDNDEDYYDMVAAQSRRKKDTKAAAAAARQEARIAGRVTEAGAPEGLDGKRVITYAIDKNKGLTPKRSKEGRNPRVKKRNRYEDKKKKLASFRPVYKGGEGRGGYGGEKTGIRKNLVKSVKL